MKIGLIDADLMWGKHANGRRYGKTKADILKEFITSEFFNTVYEAINN